MTYSLYSNKKPKTDREDTQKRRRCLKCRTLFMSAWQGERICTDCKHTSVWRTGDGWLPGEHRNDS